MTLTYRIRHIAPAVLLGLLIGVAGCGGDTASTAADSGAAGVAKPKPKPTPPPESLEPMNPLDPLDPEPAEKALPKTLGSLQEAITAAEEIHSQHRRTFYCDCAFTPQLRIARGTCGYKTRADESLSKRVAWDRVVPNRAFGEHRTCWREPICTDEEGVAFSGVRCCREVDEEFRAMELDLHNLVPAVGELQADRSDFDFGELDGEARMYGACDFEVDRSLRRAEPDEATRGDIARAYLYMHDTYGEGLPLTPAQRSQFEAWHEADPPNAWEVQRNRRVAAVQGISNSFLPMMAPPAAEEAQDAPEDPEDVAPAVARPSATPEPAEAAPKPEVAQDAPKPAAQQTQPKPEAKPEAKPEPESKPEAKPEPEPEAKAESEPEAKAEPEPEAKAEPEG